MCDSAASATRRHETSGDHARRRATLRAVCTAPVHAALAKSHPEGGGVPPLAPVSRFLRPLHAEHLRQDVSWQPSPILSKVATSSRPAVGLTGTPQCLPPQRGAPEERRAPDRVGPPRNVAMPRVQNTARAAWVLPRHYTATVLLSVKPIQDRCNTSILGHNANAIPLQCQCDRNTIPRLVHNRPPRRPFRNEPGGEPRSRPHAAPRPPPTHDLTPLPGDPPIDLQ